MQLYGLYRATSIPVSSTNQGTLSYPISLRSHLQSRDDRARRSTGVGRPEPAVRKRGAGGGRAFPDRLLSSGEAVYMLDWPSLYGFISHQLCSHCSIYLQTFSMSLLLMLMPPTPPISLHGARHPAGSSPESAACKAPCRGAAQVPNLMQYPLGGQISTLSGRLESSWAGCSSPQVRTPWVTCIHPDAKTTRDITAHPVIFIDLIYLQIGKACFTSSDPDRTCSQGSRFCCTKQLAGAGLLARAGQGGCSGGA